MAMYSFARLIAMVNRKTLPQEIQYRLSRRIGSSHPIFTAYGEPEVHVSRIVAVLPASCPLLSSLICNPRWVSRGKRILLQQLRPRCVINGLFQTRVQAKSTVCINKWTVPSFRPTALAFCGGPKRDFLPSSY